MPATSKRSQLPLELLAAGTGAAITDTLFNSLENAKVRMQLSRRHVYRTLPRTIVRVVREEGLLRGLWLPGLVASWIRAYTAVAFRVGTYPTIRDAFGANGFTGRLAAGAVSGAIGAALFSPIELVRTRMIAEAGNVCSSSALLTTGVSIGQRPKYRTTAHAFNRIAREEGLRGMWRGASASVSRAALLSGAQLATYDSSKRWAKATLGIDRDEPAALHFACAFLSGLVAQAVSMPVDTARSRMMSQVGTVGGRVDGGLMACVVGIVREEGAPALYRGLTPALCRQGPVMLVQMPLIEQLRSALGLEFL